MREVSFLNANAAKWQRFESLLADKDKKTNPNELTELFIELTDDLSYAQTYYPEGKTTKYLNTLTAKVHQSIYRNKREKLSRLVTYWTQEIPSVIRSAHKEILVSFLVFLLSAFLGVISTTSDVRFVRVILGDGYVNMTEQNIKDNNPFGVYKQEEGWLMFLHIAYNNIMVTLRVFVAGLAVSLGSIYMMFINGVMIGVFHTLFYQHGILGKSFAVVWIHGTLEISAIIVAGGAGIVLGNSILFPKTYSRLHSFMRGAKRGMKIVIGLCPVIILAAILESFVTRYTEMPFILNSLIILISASFVIGYYVIYPIYLERTGRLTGDE